MLYFSYGHDLNYRSVVEWCDLNGVRAPLPKAMTPGVASNHRLAFPVYDDYWLGGVAALIPEPGKRVSGGLLEVSDDVIELLGRLNASDRRASRLVPVPVTPYKGGKPVRAFTFVPTRPEEGHVPPTRLYVDRLVEAALELDLSAMWVMHLRSIVAGPEETSQFFPGRQTRSAPSRQRSVRARQPFESAHVPQAARPVLWAPARQFVG